MGRAPCFALLATSDEYKPAFHRSEQSLLGMDCLYPEPAP